METDIRKIAESLHPLERKLLPHITHNSLAELSSLSGIPENEISRPIQWLQEKGLVKIHEKTEEIVVLGENGKIYREKGLPEKRFVEFLDYPKSLQEIKEKSSLTVEEFNISLGTLMKDRIIGIRGGKVILLIQNPVFSAQNFIDKLPLDFSQLTESDKYHVLALKKRKDIIRIEEKKSLSAEITELGTEVQKIRLDSIADNLTPEMLAAGEWKNKSFRRYDINVPAKQIFAGRRHFVKEAIEYVRKIWLDMGFREMAGSIVQTSFWNFDALFTAQDHPVRELQDTFFIKEPKYGKLPDRQLVNAVRDMHEHGGNTGSRGWQYSWSETEARKNVLRTHTTPLSAQAIAKLRLSDLPAKFFSVGQAFRNETMDWSHLFELTQSEGIVVDENANMRHLLGYLKEFFRKMGYEKIRARPAYFPYTEPSVEIDAYHPVHKKWIELGGSGIFRPEVTVALLGKDVPVLAWGLGPGRIMMGYYGITDIRDLHRNDLKQLREIKAWMK
jgi:phenylalanyl-tRNA synthetase alpha chain